MKRKINSKKKGKCEPIPNEIKEGFFQLYVEINGADLDMPEFFFNGLEYASSKCFKETAESLIMKNLIELSSKNSNTKFKIVLRGKNRENVHFRLKIEIKNKDNTLVAKFPKDEKKYSEGMIGDLSQKVIIEEFLEIDHIFLPPIEPPTIPQIDIIA